MKRTIVRLLITGAALSLIANCGDSDTDDKGKDLGTQQVQDTGNNPKSDTDPQKPLPDGSTPKDQAVNPLQDGGTQQPTKAVSNSGQICSQTVPCPDPVNEICLPLKQGATTGMCLGKCWPNLANMTDPVNICPMADPGTMNSSCGIEVREQVNGPIVTYVCGFLCEAKQGQNLLTFKCPNDTDFNCEALNPQQPDIKVCVPKL